MTCNYNDDFGVTKNMKKPLIEYNNQIPPERYEEILTQTMDGSEDSKREIITWLKKILNDTKNMGLNVVAVDHYIQVGINAMNSNNWEKALTYINQIINTVGKLTEISFPELRLRKIKNIQFQANNWNKLDLEIINIGNIHAKDVKIFFNGEFKIKLFPSTASETNRIIKVNETKVLPIEIFPKKKGRYPLKIDLSCKKVFDDSEYKFEDRLWIQVGDGLGNTKLKRQFGYHNGYLKLELDIINEDPMDIKDVVLDLIYDEKLLTLSHIKPIFTKLGKKLQIGPIAPSDKKSITIYFDPLICADTFIGGGLSFRDWQDKDKYIMLSPQKVRILCPILYTNESIGLNELKGLLKNEVTNNGSKVIDIPLGLNIERALRICKDLIFMYNVKLVQEIVSGNPRRIEVWFYGTTEDQKNKFAIKLGIDEDTNCIELYVASTNNAAITGLLTDLLSSLNKNLINRGIIQEQLRQIENVALKENILLAKKDLIFDEIEILDKKIEKDYAQEIKEKCKPLIEKFESITKRERFLMNQYRDGTPRIR